MTCRREWRTVRGMETYHWSDLGYQIIADETGITADGRTVQTNPITLRAILRLAERTRELEICSEAIEILEEIRTGDPIFDDAKAFALAIVEKCHSLEARVAELETILEHLNMMEYLDQ